MELEEVDVGQETVFEDIDLKAAIERLPLQERTIIMLRFFEDMSLEQICNENVNTIKSRLYRTLKKLKLELAVE